MLAHDRQRSWPFQPAQDRASPKRSISFDRIEGTVPAIVPVTRQNENVDGLVRRVQKSDTPVNSASLADSWS